VVSGQATQQLGFGSTQASEEFAKNNGTFRKTAVEVRSAPAPGCAIAGFRADSGRLRMAAAPFVGYSSAVLRIPP
jgi:hypothetical protein